MKDLGDLPGSSRCAPEAASASSPSRVTIPIAETRLEWCDACDGTGSEFVRSPCHDDPYYMHQTARPCESCGGTGNIEIEVEPIEMRGFAMNVEAENWHLRRLVQCLLDNDPNDDAADGVTVLEIWRSDARRVLAQGIEAGTAETGTGSVHESPVGNADAPEISGIPVTTVKGETL